MNTQSIWLLSILLPIIFVLLMFVFYVIVKSYYLKKYTSKLEELEQFLNHEPYIDTLTALRTVDISLAEQERTMIEKISKSSNDEIKINDVKIDEINEEKEKFATQFIEIEEKIKRIGELKDEMLGNLERSRVFSCKKIANNVDILRRELNVIRQVVAQETTKYIEPITEFERKKQIYSKIIIDIETSFELWKEDVDNKIFQKNLDDKIIEIYDQLEQATQSASSGDKQEAYLNFTLLKKKIYDVLVFANYYDKFYDVLFNKANKSYEKVYDYVSKVKKNLESTLENLNVGVYLDNISDELLAAKTAFFEMNIKKTEENIEKYYNSLLSLTYIVTTELDAFNFINQYPFRMITDYYMKSYNKFNQLVEASQKILSIDKIFYWNLQKNISKLQELLSNIHNKSAKLEQELADVELTYSSKKQSYKQLLEDLLEFMELIENIEKSINIFYAEGISQGLKYNRLKKIYINGLAESKKSNVILTIEDNEIISNIEKKKQVIENQLLKNITENELKEHVDEFFDLIYDFVMKIIKKSLIIKSFALISMENSYKRIESNIFDKKITECEEMLHEGKYDLAISNLVNTVKEVNN